LLSAPNKLDKAHPFLFPVPFVRFARNEDAPPTGGECNLNAFNGGTSTMIFLPKNLGSLATLAGEENVRYSLAGIHVLDEGDFYRIEVTDGKLLAIVCGPDARSSGAGRHITDEQQQAIEEAPGGVFDLLVPASRWKEAFRQLPKDTALGLAAGEGVITLALPQAIARCSPIEGRWPNVDMVLPPTGPLVRIRVNAKTLARLLDVAAIFSEQSPAEPPAVDILFYGRDKPIGIIGKNHLGQTFDALMMPLTGKPESPRPKPSAGNAGHKPNATPSVAPPAESNSSAQRNGKGKPPHAA
jgi:hypothetical protein